jgi:hypothetical protein
MYKENSNEALHCSPPQPARWLNIFPNPMIEEEQPPFAHYPAQAP